MFAGYEAMRELFVSITKGRGGEGVDKEVAVRTKGRRRGVSHAISVENPGVISLSSPTLTRRNYI